MSKSFTPKSPPRTQKELRSPRWYWVQFHLTNDELEHKHLFKTWDSVCGLCDIWMAQQSDVQAIYLIDGNLPESELAFPPEKSVWLCWEPSQRAGAGWVKVDPAKQLLALAASRT